MPPLLTPGNGHPCLSCGACCAFFRVSFYWREEVPTELTEDSSSHYRTMRGTNQKHRCRCVALEGKVGEEVGCSIYSSRPSPCREFQASFEDGIHRLRCDQARAQYGLAPLRRKDWPFARGNPAVTLEANENGKNST